MESAVDWPNFAVYLTPDGWIVHVNQLPGDVVKFDPGNVFFAKTRDDLARFFSDSLAVIQKTAGFELHIDRRSEGERKSNTFEIRGDEQETTDPIASIKAL